MEVLPRLKDSIRYELACTKISEHFVQWLSFPSTKNLLHKLIDDAKSPYPSTQPPSAIFTNRVLTPASPNSSSPKRSSLTPPLSPPAYDRLSQTHSHSLPIDGLSTTKILPSFQASPKVAVNIPQFYFPKGKGVEAAVQEKNLKIISTCFTRENLKPADFENIVTQLCCLPKFVTQRVFSLAGGTDSITKNAFLRFWKDFECKSPVERFFWVLKKPNRGFIEREDFKPLVKVLMDSHPGLDFLKATPEFQERYSDTVVERIFFAVDLNDDGKITLRELKRSNFFEVCLSLDDEEDINKIRDYFSYEHFYVLYCRFWEIDTDHDFIIDKDDFSRYEGHTLSRKANDRIFDQAGRKFSSNSEKMTYEDFIWFMLCEEDKTSKRSLEYWFRIVDLDRNGIITAYEMEYFYEEQLRRLEYLNQEVVPFRDVLCQLSDMLCPKVQNHFTLQEFYNKRQISGVFFNALLNLNKFIAYEQRDPFSAKKEITDNPDFSEWDRFAFSEYIRLAMEEENAESNEVLDEEWDTDCD